MQEKSTKSEHYENHETFCNPSRFQTAFYSQLWFRNSSGPALGLKNNIQDLLLPEEEEDLLLLEEIVFPEEKDLLLPEEEDVRTHGAVGVRTNGAMSERGVRTKVAVSELMGRCPN